MDLFANQNLSLKILIEFLGDYGQGPGPTTQEWETLEKKYGQDLYSQIIFMLTQLEFQPGEARKHWFAILENREALSSRVGRDLGLRVALCDYFTNINPKFQNLIFVEIDALLQKERVAMVDELTGLYNRRFFNQVLKKEAEHSRRSGLPFSLLIVDVDNFKEYNDLLGHPAGDQALIKVAQLLAANARTVDHLVRYAGDEFALILPQAEKEEALRVAERHRLAMERARFEGAEHLTGGRMTASIGVATFPTDADEALDIFQKADEALFRGKSRRNVVVGWEPDQRSSPRYPFIVEMMYRLRGAEKHSYEPGETRNISLGGLLSEVQKPLEVGSLVEVKLNDPESTDSLEVQARAVRLEKSRDKDRAFFMGLSFELESDRQEQTLKEIIHQHTLAVH